MHHFRISATKVRRESWIEIYYKMLTLGLEVLQLLVDELQVWEREVDLRKTGTRTTAGVTRLCIMVGRV